MRAPLALPPGSALRAADTGGVKRGAVYDEVNPELDKVPLSRCVERCHGSCATAVPPAPWAAVSFGANRYVFMDPFPFTSMEPRNCHCICRSGGRDRNVVSEACSNEGGGQGWFRSSAQRIFAHSGARAGGNGFTGWPASKPASQNHAASYCWWW
ncbi:hypothetical protein Vretifemale_1242 [Volvox reticuliferus]|uniref:Uncharacterized protein n=1 Tax=Volvox reticuliferus TaxID=1737510 RepID=A0A8J4C314_9CHLO|nr:hypothetical protein Vretifemale_1242 [Volvox reticuliferus]